MNKKLPETKNDVSPGTLGFHEYLKCLGCPLGGISSNKLLKEGCFPGDLPSKQQIIGNIFHELMEEAHKFSTKKDLLELAERILYKYEKEYSEYIARKKYGSVRSWSGITKAVRLAFNAMAKPPGANPGSGNARKNKLLSKNGRFSGIPDGLHFSGSKAYLVEYKSTDIYDKGVINPDYIEQIKYYSFLVFENFDNVEFVIACLKSLSGSKYEIELTREESGLYLGKVNRDYSYIESQLKVKAANFIFEHCIHCNKSVICSEYKSRVDKFRTDRPIYMVSGLVVSIYEKDGLITIEFDNKKSVSLDKFTLREYVFEVGKGYTIYRLKSFGESYKWVGDSGMYEH